MEVGTVLKGLTNHVRVTKGVLAALNFHINFIQPMIGYFNGEENPNKKLLLKFTNWHYKKYKNIAIKESHIDEFIRTNGTYEHERM